MMHKSFALVIVLAISSHVEAQQDIEVIGAGPHHVRLQAPMGSSQCGLDRILPEGNFVHTQSGVRPIGAGAILDFVITLSPPAVLRGWCSNALGRSEYSPNAFVLSPATVPAAPLLLPPVDIGFNE